MPLHTDATGLRDSDVEYGLNCTRQFTPTKPRIHTFLTHFGGIPSFWHFEQAPRSATPLHEVASAPRGEGRLRPARQCGAAAMRALPSRGSGRGMAMISRKRPAQATRAILDHRRELWPMSRCAAVQHSCHVAGARLAPHGLRRKRDRAPARVEKIMADCAARRRRTMKFGARCAVRGARAARERRTDAGDGSQAANSRP